MRYTKQTLRHESRLTLTVIGGTLLLLLLAGGAVLWLHPVPHGLSNKNPNPVASHTAPKPMGGNGNAQKAGNQGSNPTPNNAGPLLIPNGDFVSNHQPSLHGQGSYGIETSTCNTTPSASCAITFTNTETGALKALETVVANASGTTYWTWRPSELGLTVGTWKIQAVAKLGGQTKTATDANSLEVRP